MVCMRTRTLTNMKGDSVKRQKSLIMKWVKSNGFSVRGEYWDVESGSKDTMDRPEFMRMIFDSERMGIRVLVFSDHHDYLSSISGTSRSSLRCRTHRSPSPILSLLLFVLISFPLLFLGSMDI